MSLDKIIKGVQHRMGIGETPYHPMNKAERDRSTAHYVRLIQERVHDAGFLELEGFLHSSAEESDKKRILRDIQQEIGKLVDFPHKEGVLARLAHLEEEYKRK